MVSILQPTDYRICIKDKKGLFSLDPFKSQKDSKFQLEVCSSIFPGKKYLATVSNSKMSIYKCPSLELLKTFDDLDLISSIDFSPKEEYVVIIQKPSIENNLKIISLQDFQIKYKFHSTIHPSSQWPQITFSNDAKIIFRQTKENVDVYTFNEEKTEKIGTVDYVLSYEKAEYKNDKGELDSVILAGRNVPNPKGGKKCLFSMFSLKCLTKPIKEMNIALTDRMKIKVSSDQNYILVQSFNDNTSSQSYYGVSTLYFTDLLSMKFIKFTLAEGPIHDFEWYPNGEHFLICAGHLPSKTNIYNREGKFVKELCHGKVNTVKISPDSRIVALAGFGSLGGDVEFYNLDTYQLIGKMNFFCCVAFYWSLDSKYILGSVLSTRVKVDNEYRILKYNGEEVLCDKKIGEIYDCIWINDTEIPYTSFPIEVFTKSLEKKVETGMTLGKLTFGNSNLLNTDKPMQSTSSTIPGMKPKKNKKK